MKLIAAFALSLALLPVAPSHARAEAAAPRADATDTTDAPRGDVASPKGDAKRAHGARKAHRNHRKTVAQRKQHTAPAAPKEEPPREPGFDDRKIAAVKVAAIDDAEPPPAETHHAEHATTSAHHAGKRGHADARPERRSRVSDKSVKRKKPAHRAERATAKKPGHDHG